MNAAGLVTASPRIRVLLIEDNPGDARLLREELSAATTAIEFTHVLRLDQGIARLQRDPFDLLLLDLHLPDSRGYETFERALTHAGGTPIVVLSGLSDESVGVQAVQNGAQDYLVKGQIAPGLLERTIRYAVERARSGRALKASEERYRQFFEDDFAGAFIASPDGRILACNPAFARMFGFDSPEESSRRSVGSYFSSADEAVALREKIRQEKKLVDYEFTAKRSDGKPVYVIGNVVGEFQPDGELTEIKGYLFDNSQRKRLEEELRQSQKMESIGRLAGGVAHDFNNLLTAILGYTDLLLTQFEPEDSRRGEVEEIRDAGQRAAVLTKQLLAFSRRQVLQPRVLDMKEVVLNMKNMLQRLLGEDIELKTTICADPCRVRADAGQIEQVIVNLSINARDAMPSGGALTISAQTFEVKDAERHIPVRLAPGPYVLLSFEDTGIGIDPRLLPQLFEPFFTTKELGKGTGLGLSTVYGIVKQSGGEIAVESEVGRGTIFRIYLPIAEQPQTAAPSPGAATARATGSETILLVEDEEAVRAIVRRLLQAAGYFVLEAEDGAQALESCDRYSGAIDLVLTDLMMPRMSGRELAERIVQLRPGIRILFMSGYTEDALLRKHLAQSGTAFIQKPFAAAALANKVREILDTHCDAAIVDPPPDHLVQ